MEKPKKIRKIEIGTSDFKKVIQEDMAYVDKTLLVLDVLESEFESALILRPRRWGKSLNLAMLDYFFSLPVDDKGTLDSGQVEEKQRYFSSMNIGRYPEVLRDHLGKYPVIRLDFSGMVSSNFERFEKEMADRLAGVYLRHQYLLQSPSLNSAQCVFFQEMLEARRFSSLPEGIRFLSECLTMHFKKKVIVLIDEYDALVNTVWGQSLNGRPGAKEFLESLVRFLGGFYSNSCKGNPHVQKNVVTGIFRILKGSLGTAMNSFAEFSLLKERFGRDFGFSEAEIEDLFIQRGVPKNQRQLKLQEARAWYNGYSVAAHPVYNPWSIMHWLVEGKIGPYWIQVGSVEVALALGAYEDFLESFQKLLSGGTIEACVRSTLILNDGTFTSLATSSFWTLLVFAGFLNVEQILDEQELDPPCVLKIPNREVRGAFQLQLLEVLKNRYQVGPAAYQVWMDALVLGQLDVFEASLRSFIDRNFNVRSVDPKKVEAFYQGFVLGLSAVYDKTYILRCEFPTGLGYVDTVLIPREETQRALLAVGKPKRVAVILEYKRCVTGTPAALKKAVASGFNQITQKGYRAEVDNAPQVDVCLDIVIAFSGKKFLLKSRQWTKKKTRPLVIGSTKR